MTEPVRLSDQARIALARAEALVDRDHALMDLADLLRCESTWALAGAIEDQYRRFRSVAYERIAAGRRDPANVLEAALLALAEAECPTTQRKIWPILVDLRL
jgi:hypothetical protein